MFSHFFKSLLGSLLVNDQTAYNVESRQAFEGYLQSHPKVWEFLTFVGGECWIDPKVNRPDDWNLSLPLLETTILKLSEDADSLGGLIGLRDEKCVADDVLRTVKSSGAVLRTVNRSADVLCTVNWVGGGTSFCTESYRQNIEQIFNWNEKWEMSSDSTQIFLHWKKINVEIYLIANIV